MKVWKLIASSKALTIMPIFYENEDIDPELSEAFRQKTKCDGRVKEKWKPIEFISTGRNKSKCDFVYYTSGKPVFSNRAKDSLEKYIASDVQFLPIVHELELYLVNVVNVLDAVDYSRSICRDNPWKVFNGFEKISFKEEAIKEQLIFKVEEEAEHDVFVTDAFKEIVEQNKLTGFEFIEIWDSELTASKEAEMKEAFDRLVLQNNQLSEQCLDWNAAYELVTEGKAVVSGEWRLQKNSDGEIVLGRLTIDLSYVWMDPDYYPPILFSLQWFEAERAVS